MIEFPQKIESIQCDLKCQMLEQNQNCTRQYANSAKNVSDSSVLLLSKVIKIFKLFIVWLMGFGKNWRWKVNETHVEKGLQSIWILYPNNPLKTSNKTKKKYVRRVYGIECKYRICDHIFTWNSKQVFVKIEFFFFNPFEKKD